MGGVFLALCIMPYILCAADLKEDWNRWRRYRKELRQAITKAEQERIKITYWLNSGKF